MTRQPTRRPMRRPFAALALIAALVIIGSVAACSASAEKLTGPTWQLTSVTEKVPAFQGVVPPEDQSRYTITFNEDGTAAIKADCNNVAGHLHHGGDEHLDRPRTLDARRLPG